ncbi:HEPN domain-containing protein [Exiguobacterium sp. s192]|uniref:HEPN domain-containing protein n=1 Tax=Exiguobacterium sp. s192 TaxID=2751206 RepID=UPI001BE9C620|nr:HEPN domain-containing protein [Exiguobacterium sp. s192]
MNKPQNEVLFDLLYPLVVDGIEKVKIVVGKNKLKVYSSTPYYFNYPTVKYWRNGMPNFSTTFLSEGSSPVRYEEFLKSQNEKNPSIVLEELINYKEVFSNLYENENYRMVYSYPDEENEEKSDLDLLEIAVNNHIKGLISRSLHHWGEEVELTKENFLEIYLPFENSIYLEKLPVSFYVPILFLNFDFDLFRIDKNLSIVKLDEKMQLSRNGINSFIENINEVLLSCATHALVIDGYNLKNGNRFENSRILNEPNAYPLETINNFFNALRMVIDHPTGYAQVITKPIDWTYSYRADLINLSGFSISAFPHEFKDYYWLKPSIPSISTEELRSIDAIYNGLEEKENKKIQLACKRLESCYLRKDERDIIIDAVIGLESLLSDSEKGEITHKLSMRIAFLLQLSSLNQSKLEIFSNMKHIYSFRSLIVHGDLKWEKKRKIELESLGSILTADLAVMYLKECIVVILQNKEYTDAKMIDMKMILSN